MPASPDKAKFYEPPSTWRGMVIPVGGIVVAILLAAVAVDPRSWRTADLKNVAELAGVFAAGAYFLWRLVNGFFLVNLSATVTCARTRQTSTHDWVAATVTLKKGDRGTVMILDASVRFLPEGSEGIVRPIESLARLSFDNNQVETRDGHFRRVSVNWSRRSKRAPFVNLTPGEEISASCYASVPAATPCLIELALLGRRPSFSTIAQWRTSCTSLPLDVSEQGASDGAAT